MSVDTLEISSHIGKMSADNRGNVCGQPGNAVDTREMSVDTQETSADTREISMDSRQLSADWFALIICVRAT